MSKEFDYTNLKHVTSVDQSDRKVPYNLRQSGPTKVEMLISTRVRKSPYWHLSMQAGCWRATVYNRIYHPRGYVKPEDGAPMDEYDAIEVNKDSIKYRSFERQKIVSSFILQESKVIGEGDNFSGVTTRPLSPFFYEVSFKIKDLLSENELYQFGRFELAFGKQRIISKNNWNNVGRTFEGFLYSGNLYKKNRANVFSLGLNEQVSEENDDSKDSWLNGIYYSAAIKNFENSSLILSHFKIIELRTIFLSKVFNSFATGAQLYKAKALSLNGQDL